jgi:hypothetical protein
MKRIIPSSGTPEISELSEQAFSDERITRPIGTFGEIQDAMRSERLRNRSLQIHFLMTTYDSFEPYVFDGSHGTLTSVTASGVGSQSSK